MSARPLDIYRQRREAEARKRKALSEEVAGAPPEARVAMVAREATAMLDNLGRRIELVDATLDSLVEEGLSDFLPLALAEAGELRSAADALAPRILAIEARAEQGAEALVALDLAEASDLCRAVEAFELRFRRSFFSTYLERLPSVFNGRTGGGNRAKLPGILAAVGELLREWGHTQTEGFYWIKTERWTEDKPLLLDGFEVYRDGDKLVQASTGVVDGSDASIGPDAFCRNYLRPLKKPRTEPPFRP